MTELTAMKRSSLLAIQTGVDILVLDIANLQFTRVPVGTKISDTELAHYSWFDYSEFCTVKIGGVKKYRLSLTPTNRITGHVIGTTRV